MYNLMKYEKLGEFLVILYLMVLIYNFITVKVGMNQIQNSFMSQISKDTEYITKKIRESLLQGN